MLKQRFKETYCNSNMPNIIRLKYFSYLGLLLEYGSLKKKSNQIHSSLLSEYRSLQILYIYINSREMENINQIHPNFSQKKKMIYMYR